MTVQPRLRAPLSRALAAPDPIAPLVEEIAQGVFVFDAMPPSYCERLRKDLATFPSVAPNSMNRYGLVLADAGYGALCETLLVDVVNPLARRFYPSFGPLTKYHGFTVNYSAKQRNLDAHHDDCDVTLNICLGGDFKGGKLAFYDDDDNIVATLDHVVGQAVLHPGSYSHAAQNIRSGTRTNLILWCSQ